MYSPTAEKVVGAGPRPGLFYRRDAGSYTTVAHIAEVAAKNSPIPISTASMVILIANSPWNKGHIRYGQQGYSAYSSALVYKDTQGRGTGPQMEAKYSPDPTSTYGTGGNWPTFWIPTPDGKEPTDVFGPPKLALGPGVGAGSGGSAGVFTPIGSGGSGAGVVTPILSPSNGAAAGGGAPVVPGTPGAPGGVALAGAGSKWWMWALAAAALVGVYFWQKDKKKKGTKRTKARRKK